MKKIFRVLLGVFALLLSACILYPGIAEALEGKVVRISDGDTLTILTADRQQLKIRLYGIDTPERRQAYGSRATDYTRKALAGRRVQVRAIDRDRYGRTVGIVQAEGARESINAELIRAGLAWIYTKFCKLPQCREWKRIEEDARKQKKGLWQDAGAVPPWQWRRGER